MVTEYNTEEKRVETVAEPAITFNPTRVSVPSCHQSLGAASRPGRMTVDEYFDKVRAVLRRKYEDL